MKIGEHAPDLDLLDEAGRPVVLSSLARGPLVVLVFRGPDDAEGLELLRDYRDYTLALRRAGIAIAGVAHADPSALAFMRMERALGFPLLSDADGTQLSRIGMLDQVGLVLLDRNLRVKQIAPGHRAPAQQLLSLARRGHLAGAGLRDRFAHLLQLLAHAITPRKLAR
jgi:peroxiredoxin